MTGKSEIDMCRGQLLGKMIRFTVPIMLTGILQLLFNAADIVVVGRFAGSQALAAVGSTTSLINMMVNLFVGCAVGANVLVAGFYGSKEYDKVSDAVHTALLASVIGGIFLAVIGITFARPLLHLMGSPNDVIDLAVLYVRIYFAGIPIILLYNFGSSIMKAAGDADHPLIYLTIAGVLNVFLNLFFVIVLHMSVAGVAIATVLSSVIIQSSVNSFGSVVMAGNSAAANIEGFCYSALNACNQTSLNFTSQNRGARQYHRTSQVLRIGVGIALVTGVAFAVFGVTFAGSLVSIYSSEAEVISYGILRLTCILPFYWMSGIMEVLVGYIRGIGYSLMSTIVTLLGSCAFRIIWVYTVFRAQGTLESLYVSYPISWAITICAHVVCMVVTCRKYWGKKDAAESAA